MNEDLTQTLGDAVEKTVEAAEEAVRTPFVRRLARFGFYAKGTLYIVVGALAVMLSIDARLTLFSLIPLPFVSLSVKYFGSAIHKRFEEIQAQLSEVSAIAQEAQTILHLLDYVGVDYAGAVKDGKVTSAEEFKEMLTKELPVTDQPNVFTGNASGNNNGRDCLIISGAMSATSADSCMTGHPYVCECDGQRANPANF